jgi:toxin-antitoxin system PIN domain toxin
LKYFLIDTNVLLADVLDFHVHHTLARQWFTTQESNTIFYLPRVVQISFMRLLTSESVLKEDAVTNQKAIEVWEELMFDTRFQYLADKNYKLIKWPFLGNKQKRDPKLWMDGYLAGLAIENSLVLVSLDKGFKKMKQEGLDLECLL